MNDGKTDDVDDDDSYIKRENIQRSMVLHF